MKYFLIIIMFLCFSLTGCNNNNSANNQNEDNNYTASRTTATDNTNNINNTTNNIKSIDNINIETEIASFSTKIYTPNDEARQNNIRITCSKLNGTVVKSR